jgi:transposase InsO family protein
MSARTVTVAVGHSVSFDGRLAQIVEFDGRAVMLRFADGGYSSIALAEFAARACSVEPVDGEGDPGLALAGLTPEQREQVERRARHIREVLTGYSAGHAETAAAGEPRAAFAPGTLLKDRYAAKAAELGVASRTVERWAVAYRDGGEAALVDDRRRRGRSVAVDPRWDAAVRAELAATVNSSTPSRAKVLMHVQQRLEAEFGAGVVPIPARTTAYRRLGVLAKGTNALSGSAKGRRSIAERPGGVYGRLRAARPGEYLILDTQDLDVYAMEPVTCRWAKAQLTLAQDLFDRQILGLKVTAVSTKAVDVAGVLFEAVTGRSGSRIGLGPLHGLPEQLVFTEAASGEPVWCPPETLVVDHGRAFLSAHVIGVCARLGISIQPAQPHKPTDKGVVERTFSSINTLFCQHVAGYVGSNVTRRGQDVEAVWTLRELADLFEEWLIACWQNRPHDGLRSPFLPGRALSRNEVYALLVAGAGHVPVCLSGDDYIELLPAQWRRINDYGIVLDYRTYDCQELGHYRRQPSGVDVKGGLWEVHHDPYDLSHVWVRDTRAAGWITVPWTRPGSVSAPFADFTWRRARALLAARGADDTDEQAIAAAVEDLLTRAGAGPDRKVAARTRAATAMPGRPGIGTESAADDEAESVDDAPLGKVIPFGVCDAFTDGSRR